MPDNPDKTDPIVPTEEEEFEDAIASAPPEDLDRTIIRENGKSEEKTPAGKAQLPYVVIVQGPRSGTRFGLNEETNVVGRSPDCAVRLEDQSVSRQHAEITRAPGGWMVRDLGSKNGTIVNQSPVTEPIVIGHKDFVKVGIYLLRLITQETSRAEEMTLPPEMVSMDSTLMTEMPPVEAVPAKAEKEKPPVEESPPEEAVKKPSIVARYRKFVAPAVLGLIIVAAGAYLAQRFFAPPKKPPKKVASVKGPAVKPPPGKPIAQPPRQPIAVPAKPPPPVVKKVPVFLDFVSSPLPATIMFQSKELGRTPLRVNVELEGGKSYEASGTFEMPAVSERYVQKLSFTVDPAKSVIPLLFRGPIGMIKINDLPRDVQFYLEGRFEYDKFSERPAKLGEIVLRKPIYLPFGTYTMELRSARQLGASQTYVQDIVYRREFAIAADNPSVVLAITAADLKKFPVMVRSEPPNADVYIDGKRVGKTPYEGTFPLGEHALTLRKEGYFEYTEELKVDINTPFTTTITLQTSVAGAHINNAQAAMNRAMYPEAVNELAEALASNPAPSEIAKANYMLGTCYLKQNDVARAANYFELARQHEEQRYPAMLGLVQCHAAMKQTDKALPLLVEVLLNAKDENVKREANGLFAKISPFRSVVYVYSNPVGAAVTLNDKKVAQPTPVILHDMSLGTYKLRIVKPGYIPVDMRLDLSVNEFNPVIVTLKPIPR